MKISVERIFQAKGIASAKTESVRSLACTRTNKEPGVAGAERKKGKEWEVKWRNNRWLNNGGSGDHCMNFGSFTDWIGKPLKGFEQSSSIADVILTAHLAVVWRLDGRGYGTQ